MKDYHSKKIEIIHRLAEYSPASIDELANKAKELAQKSLNSIPIEKLQQLAKKITYLQDNTRLKIPCQIKGDLFVTARFYPSEGQFEHESSPDLWISELILGESERVLKEEETNLFGQEIDHVYLRKELQPDLDAFSEFREFEKEIKAISEEYGVDLFDLTRALNKIKECFDIDEYHKEENRK